MRADILTSILSELNGSSADIEASAVVSSDGLMMAARLPVGLDESRTAPVIAALLSLANYNAKGLSRGNLEQVLTKGDKGYILMTHVGEDAALTVLATPQADLGLIFSDVKRAAKSLEQVLTTGDKGYILMTDAGEDALLTMLAKSQAELGLIFSGVKRAAEPVGMIT